MDGQDGSEEFWLFGYGSLIWKPPPHFDRRLAGYVEGYVRRFWQLADAKTLRQGEDAISRPEAASIDDESEDHRGTPEAPGRVVTLIEKRFWQSLQDEHTVPEERVWGAAYRIEASKVAEVQEYLDIREINGYSIQYTSFQPSSGAPSIRCLVYIGLPNNPQFTGVQDPQALSEHIFRSKGPSGQNKEYLFMLEKALHDLGSGSGDKHVEDLADRVRNLQVESAQGTAQSAIQHELHRVESGRGHGEQEEVE